MTYNDRRDKSLDAIIELAHGLGWDGVNNSKILEIFLADYIEDLQQQLKHCKQESRENMKLAMEFQNRNSGYDRL